MQLVIVESPAKAKTIEKYLGADFQVLASYGHIRDLPPKDGSVRPDDDFSMDWEIYRDKQSRLKEITESARKADRLILATDPDREGEAISWHVQELLKKRKNFNMEILNNFKKMQLSLVLKKKKSQFIIKNNFKKNSVKVRVKEIIKNLV